MTTYTTYTTREGQRWDTVAYEVYGDPYGYVPIIQANPVYRMERSLAGAIKLKIPALDITVARVDPELLPPWKR